MYNVASFIQALTINSESIINHYINNFSHRIQHEKVNGMSIKAYYLTTCDPKLNIFDKLPMRKGDITEIDKNGNTLLHLATKNKLPDISYHLLTLGSSISSVNFQGYTPLHYMFMNSVLFYRIICTFMHEVYINKTNPNDFNTAYLTCDKNNKIPLQYSVKEFYSPVVISHIFDYESVRSSCSNTKIPIILKSINLLEKPRSEDFITIHNFLQKNFDNNYLKI